MLKPILNPRTPEELKEAMRIHELMAIQSEKRYRETISTIDEFVAVLLSNEKFVDSYMHPYVLFGFAVVCTIGVYFLNYLLK